jgi:hypothetical protein
MEFPADIIVMCLRYFHLVYKINLKDKMKIGTLNVRTILRSGILEEIKCAMLETGIDILGVCGTRWGGKGDFTLDNVRVIYSGLERTKWSITHCGKEIV